MARVRFYGRYNWPNSKNVHVDTSRHRYVCRFEAFLGRNILSFVFLQFIVDQLMNSIDFSWLTKWILTVNLFRISAKSSGLLINRYRNFPCVPRESCENSGF